MIPEEAIVPQGGKQYVIKLVDAADGKTRTSQRVEVKVGLRSPGKVEIVAGLDAGDTVVTSGQQRVQRDGSPVTVVEVAGRNGRGAAEKPAAIASAAASAAALNSATFQAASAPAVAPSVSALVAEASSGSAPLAGPNPCGISTAGTTSSAKPAGKPSVPERSRDAPPRDPA